MEASLTDVTRRALEYDDDESQSLNGRSLSSTQVLFQSSTTPTVGRVSQTTTPSTSFAGRPSAPVGVGLTSAALSQCSTGHCSSAPLWGGSGTKTMYESALEAANAALYSTHRQKCATDALLLPNSLPSDRIAPRFVASPMGVSLAVADGVKSTPLTNMKTLSASEVAAPSPSPQYVEKATPHFRRGSSLSKRCSLLSSNGGCTASRHGSSLQGATPAGHETWEDVFELE